MATTYEPISSTTLGADAFSVTLSSIPGTYTDLILVCNTKDTRAISGGCDFYLYFNGNGGTNDYSRTRLVGNGSAASASRTTNTASIQSVQPGNTSTYQVQIYQIMNYANTNTFKTVLARNNHAGNGVIATAGIFRSTSAITSLTLVGEQGIASGSIFTLYGVKAA